MTEPLDTLVLGAGLTGCVIARGLADAGRSVRVLEKSRGLGGRLATRRAGDWRFDHGAQYLKGEGPAATLWPQLEVAGAAALWHVPGRGPRHVGLPGMSGLVAPLAQGLDIRREAEVARVSREGGRWRAEDASGALLGEAVRLVSAIPAPQAQQLFAVEALAAPLAGVAMAPCWTLMAAFAGRPDLPEAAGAPDAPLAWIARDGSKPGRGDAESWVIQASPAWSTAELEQTREEAAVALLALLAERAGGRLPQVLYASAHRWRYAQAATPLGAPCLADADRGLVISGDWCLGARAGDAVASARAALTALGVP